MKKYILEYQKEIEEKIKTQKFTSSDIKILKEKIAIFQHERLIHLLVTLTFAFFAILFMALGMLSYIFLIPFFCLIVFLIFYIIHYFFLENSVQYFYKLYDQMQIHEKVKVLK